MGKFHFPPQASRSSIARFYDSVAWCFKTQTKLPAMKAIELTPGQFSIPRQKICDITALSNTSPRGMNVKERLTTVTLSHEKYSSPSESLSSILPIHERYETSYCLPFFTITVMSFEMFCLLDTTSHMKSPSSIPCCTTGIPRSLP